MKKKILAIDECKAMRYILTSVFSKGYDVTTLPDPCSAVHHLSINNQQDLIILNIPDAASDNFRLLEHITSSAYTRTTPMVVLSDVNNEAFAADIVKLGASFFLTKPFDPAVLADKVRELTQHDTAEILPKRRRLINMNIF